MRVAVWHNLPSGGGKRALFDHVTGLVGAGHEVEVWAPPTADPDYLPLREIVTEHIVPLERPARQTRRERWQLALLAERQIEAMDRHCQECARQMSAGGFDVLFANACQFYRTTSIGRFCDLPSALYLGEPYRWLYEAMPNNVWAAPAKSAEFGVKAARRGFAEWREVRNLRVQVREEIENAKAFDRILCNSYFSRETILRSYGVDAQVCYLGIDANVFRASSESRRDHIIGLGAYTREKNLELCLRAVSKMADPRPKLIWVGNVGETYIPELMRLATELGVVFDPRIKISDEELLDVLSTATAMIYAPRLEPFGLAPLEAGACGVPVVAVAEGGVRETVENGVNGLLADASPEALAVALDRLRADPALAFRLGEAGRAKVKTFWSKNAGTARLVAALEGVVAGRATPQASLG